MDSGIFSQQYLCQPPQYPKTRAEVEALIMAEMDRFAGMACTPSLASAMRATVERVLKDLLRNGVIDRVPWSDTIIEGKGPMRVGVTLGNYKIIGTEG